MSVKDKYSFPSSFYNIKLIQDGCREEEEEEEEGGIFLLYRAI
jgi:hypothetical protein